MASGRQLAVPGQNKIRKASKMRISFRQRIRAWLFEENNENDSIVLVDHDQEQLSTDDGINFNVINAAGGRIVQVRYYDKRADRHKHSLHIITPEENLAEALAHILTLETLGK